LLPGIIKHDVELDHGFTEAVPLPLLALDRLTNIKELGKLVGVETDLAYLEVQRLDLADFHAQQVLIPAGIHGQLIVGEDIGLLLRLTALVAFILVELGVVIAVAALLFNAAVGIDWSASNE
jgi:hypothetical protein